MKSVKINILLAKWMKKSDLPLGLLGLLYLGVYSTQVISQSQSQFLEITSWVIWAIFLLETLAQFLVSTSLGAFFKQNWLGVLAIFVPMARGFRVFRIFLALRALKHLTSNRAKATSTYIGFLLPLVWFVGAVAVLDAEISNPESSITNLREALWWSLATLTTVGYGDKYPITLEGQLVAAGLMLSGIALFSAAAGLFASWILKSKEKA